MTPRAPRDNRDAPGQPATFFTWRLSDDLIDAANAEAARVIFLRQLHREVLDDRGHHLGS